MNIICPQCRFSREVPEDRLPGAAAIATCPQCSHRFRICRPERNSEKRPTGEPPLAADACDDPLPPGAVIPDSGRDAESDSGPEPIRAANAEGGKSDEDAERRQAALDAYRRQAERSGPEQAGHAPAPDAALENLENPWEHAGRIGYPAAFYQTAVRVMFAAPRFFAGLKPDAPQGRALVFYLIVGLCQILLERFWGDMLARTLEPYAGNDPQMRKLIQLFTPHAGLLMAVLLRSAVLTLNLFVIAGLYFLLFRLIAPDRADYQLIFQVLAYSSAPALLCVVPVIGSVAGIIWGAACSFVGCRYALKLTWTQTALGLAPVYAIIASLALHMLQAVQASIG